MQEIATILGFPDDAAKYANILASGKKAYHSLLWNGRMPITDNWACLKIFLVTLNRGVYKKFFDAVSR